MEENQETKNNKQENEENTSERPAVNLPAKIERISEEKIRGRIVIFNPEKSEFAKNLNLDKAGDYVQAKK